MFQVLKIYLTYKNQYGLGEMVFGEMQSSIVTVLWLMPNGYNL